MAERLYNQHLLSGGTSICLVIIAVACEKEVQELHELSSLRGPKQCFPFPSLFGSMV